MIKKHFFSYLLLFLLCFLFLGVKITNAYTVTDRFDFLNYDEDDDEKKILICDYERYYDDDGDTEWQGAFQIYATSKELKAVSLCRECAKGYYTINNDDDKYYDYLSWGELDIGDTDDSNTYIWQAGRNNKYGDRGVVKNGTLYGVRSDYASDNYIYVYFSLKSGSAVKNEDATYNRVRTRFVDEGICPRWAYVSVDQRGNSGDTINGVDGLYFSNSESWEKDEHPEEPNDYSTKLVYSKFEQDLVFQRDINACVTSETSNDYYNLFGEILYFKKNPVILKMYKANHVCDIANAVYNNAVEGSSCSYHDSALSVLAKRIADMEFCEPDEKPIEDPDKCSSYLGNINRKGSTAYYLDKTFSFITYAAIAVLIVMTTIDYIKCLASQDKDALKKVNITTIKRIVFTFLLFLLPIILRTILPIFGIISDCNVGGLNG